MQGVAVSSVQGVSGIAGELLAAGTEVLGVGATPGKHQPSPSRTTPTRVASSSSVDLRAAFSEKDINALTSLAAPLPGTPEQAAPGRTPSAVAGDAWDVALVRSCAALERVWALLVAFFAGIWDWCMQASHPLTPVHVLQARKVLGSAATYDEWRNAAETLDRAAGAEQWASDPVSPHYDHATLTARLRKLKQIRISVTRARSQAERGRALERMTHTLRSGLHRNLAGLGNPTLYEHTFCGTKGLIEDYVDEVLNQLLFLAKQDTRPALSPAEKLLFFRETRHAFGRTALMLSGGGSLAFFHIGVIRALLDAGVLPRVISGSSGGAVVAAFAGTKTDAELRTMLTVDAEGNLPAVQLQPFETLSTGSVRRKLTRLFTKGVLYDIRVLGRFLRANIGDLTFLEAYRKTHRILNITVTSSGAVTNGGDEAGHLLNYLTAPNVIIWTAVLASCSIPFVFEPVELWTKTSSGQCRPYHMTRTQWIDGSLGGDLPAQRLGELFNVNHTIVSQINPWAAPFIPASDVPVGDMPWSATGLLHRTYYAVGASVRFAAQLAGGLGILPSVVSRALRLVWQQYTGDITIVPTQLTPWELSYVLRNPSQSFLGLALARGQLRTWPKMSLILSRCAVEQALERCVRMLQGEVGGNEAAAKAALPAPPLVLGPVSSMDTGAASSGSASPSPHGGADDPVGSDMSASGFTPRMLALPSFSGASFAALPPPVSQPAAPAPRTASSTATRASPLRGDAGVSSVIRRGASDMDLQSRGASATARPR